MQMTLHQPPHPVQRSEERGKHQKSRFGSSTESLGVPALKQQQNILEFPLIPHFVPATSGSLHPLGQLSFHLPNTWDAPVV